ncbi:MAG TPA: GNAT family N-acetyltransferase [Croceibacterium sp.]|nr:GNAT family N-acetyltransferase [Croceibacterium sp.]
MATTALDLENYPAPARPAAGTPTLSARALAWRDLEAAEWRAAWGALAARAAEPNPFFESWSLLPALRALDPTGEVELLIVEGNGMLAGLMPVRRERSYYGRRLPHVRGWIHANAFLGVPLVARGSETAFWQALLTWCDAQASGSLFLHLAEIPLDSPLNAALAVELRRQHRQGAVVMREDRALLQSSLGAEEYYEASLSGKKRKELRRQHNRLAEEGDLTFERRRDCAGIDQWIADFLALEADGWKGKAGSALASDRATAALFAETAAEAARLGRLERLTLTLDGKPIAMLANLIAVPGAFSYKTAFDERYARFSPGVLLQRENLALLDDGEVRWCDSCAASGHPMIDHIWRERRAIGRLSIAIGGPLRRIAFTAIAAAETRGRRGSRISALKIDDQGPTA